MSYTLSIEPEIVKEAETCAVRNGTTLDAMIRACLLVFVSRDAAGGWESADKTHGQKSKAVKIGLMKNEVKLPAGFDETFDSLDGEIASMFTGASL